MAVIGGLIVKQFTVEFSYSGIPPDEVSHWGLAEAYPSGHKLLVGGFIGSAGYGAGYIICRTGKPRLIGLAPYDGTIEYNLLTVPQGFQVDDITQGETTTGLWPNIGIPGFNYEGNIITLWGQIQGFGSYVPGWTDWTTNLGHAPLPPVDPINDREDRPPPYNVIGAPIIFTPATMSVMYLQDWIYEAHGAISIEELMSASPPTLRVPDGGFFPDGEFQFTGHWTADPNRCEIFGPVRNVRVINGFGEIQWELPEGATGTIVDLTVTGEFAALSRVYYTAQTRLLPPAGETTTVKLTSCTHYPLCRGGGGVPVEVTVTPTPDIASFQYEMFGGMNFSGSALFQVIGNPAGIYVLTPGLGHDVLYERLADLTTQVFPIPRPFIKTSFFGK